MSSSTYYWSHRAIQGFGKMWFLIVPQMADTEGGGAEFLGSVVEEVEGRLFPGGDGIKILGKDFPKPEHFTTPQLILKEMQSRRKALRFAEDEPLIFDSKPAPVNQSFTKSNSLKSSVGSFPGLPSLPIDLEIDYGRMETISIRLGENTRKRYIPLEYLIRLKNSVDGDDQKITQDFSIAKEAIVNQILVTDRYSITFESVETFDADFETKLGVANTIKAGEVSVGLEPTARRQVTVTVDDGHEYLIALKTVDWDDL
jgi:hypothetical protein